ncbi:MAG: carbohydrate porin, partial [Methylomonas sp.]
MFPKKTHNRPFSALLVICLLLLATAMNAFAISDPNELDIEEPFSIMRLLADQGWHFMDDENWNVHGQASVVSQWKPSFPAAYTNLGGGPNSLLPQAERSNTNTVDFYAGLRTPWRGGEIYYAPEMIAEDAFSNLKGLGGAIQNGELQKSGAQNSSWYTSRFYLRQTFNMGGAGEHAASGPLQLAGAFDSRRLVVSVGTMSIIDIFDKNAYAGDVRQQFVSMAFMTNAAYDFAADVHGYSTGAAAEFYHDAWAFRFGRFMPPQDPNGKPLSYRLFKYFGQQIEVEHRHAIGGQPGAIRVLAYRNQAFMGKFSDAVSAFNSNPAQYNAANCVSYNYGNTNAQAPDLCWARKTNVKMGAGLNMEQSLAHGLGVFLRGMYSDGQTEDDSFTSADRSLSYGTLLDGENWGRNKDAIGAGYAISWISAAHIAYLNMGGIDQFIGDGKINFRPEHVLELFYKLNVYKTAWLTFDYQH